MDLREPPIITNNPELSVWLKDLHSKVLSDNSSVSSLIVNNTYNIQQLASKWCTDGSGGSLTIGMLVYFSAIDTVNLADGSDSAKRARGFCTDIDTNALVSFVGPVDAVPIESGITVSFGDTLWLSVTDPGKYTNVRPTSGIRQRVGFAIDDGNAASFHYKFQLAIKNLTL